MYPTIINQLREQYFIDNSSAASSLLTGKIHEQYRELGLLPFFQPEWYEEVESDDNDLVEETSDGEFTPEVREIVYGKEYDYEETLAAGDDFEEGEYLDPKFLLPDLYSATLFEEEEDDFLPPAFLLYRPNPDSDHYELDYLLLKEEPEEGVEELLEELETTEVEGNLESRLE